MEPYASGSGGIGFSYRAIRLELDNVDKRRQDRNNYAGSRKGFLREITNILWRAQCTLLQPWTKNRSQGMQP